jgi:hypothetical protein
MNALINVAMSSSHLNLVFHKLQVCFAICDPHEQNWNRKKCFAVPYPIFAGHRHAVSTRVGLSLFSPKEAGGRLSCSL